MNNITPEDLMHLREHVAASCLINGTLSFECDAIAQLIEAMEAAESALARVTRERDWLAKQCAGWAAQMKAPALSEDWWLLEAARQATAVSAVLENGK